MKKVKPLVFLPPFIICLVAITLSFRYPEAFTSNVDAASGWVMDTFGWLISLAAFGMVVLCALIFVSPFGRTVLGGPNARPLLNRYFPFG